jgi:hypothetical protein
VRFTPSALCCRSERGRALPCRGCYPWVSPNADARDCSTPDCRNYEAREVHRAIYRSRGREQFAMPSMSHRWTAVCHSRSGLGGLAIPSNRQVRRPRHSSKMGCSNLAPYETVYTRAVNRSNSVRRYVPQDVDNLSQIGSGGGTRTPDTRIMISRVGLSFLGFFVNQCPNLPSYTHSGPWSVNRWTPNFG